jgi:1,2-diacylglycerol 3-alpha-glucosyltransferase
MTVGGSLTIAIFGESYLPYLSGVTVATEALARGLGAAGHRVILAVPRPADGAPGTAGAVGPEPEAAWLPSYQGPPPAPPAYRMPWPMPSAALAKVRAARPDIVHAQSPFVSGLMARRLARAVGAPLVFTHHTRFGDYAHYLGPLARPGSALVHAYLRAFWAGCAAVVAPAADLAAEIEAGVGATRDRTRRDGGLHRPVVRAIPSGIELAMLRDLAPTDPRPGAGWPADAIVAVSVGRLAREKSSDLLVDAFAAAVRDEPRLRLLLVGGGPLQEGLDRQVAALGLGDMVQLTGRLARLDALALAAGCDFFVFASRTETQGLVLAEALAVGLPVVALDGPGVRDSVRDGRDGLVIERRGSAARDLGAAMASLADDAARRARMATAAREGAGRFAAAARIDEMVALYRSLRARSR